MDSTCLDMTPEERIRRHPPVVRGHAVEQPERSAWKFSGFSLKVARDKSRSRHDTGHQTLLVPQTALHLAETQSYCSGGGDWRLAWSDLADSEAGGLRLKHNFGKDAFVDLTICR